MSLYAYFQREMPSGLPKLPPAGSTLTQVEINKANKVVKEIIKSEGEPKRRRKYVTYKDTERAKIGKYASEHGTTRACKYFSHLWKKDLPETTVRRFKDEYLKQLAKEKHTGKSVEALPTKRKGRPLLVGAELDTAIQDYLKSLRLAGGVVNTIITLGAAEGIISARYPGKLQRNGGDLCIGKDWAKSLMLRMGYVKRKVSNAGKVLVADFEGLKEQFLADTAAEIIMNDIPAELVINWDQTGLKIIPTGDWTMHRSGEKVIPIVGSDDKREITAVLAATATGQCLPPQLLYKGKTQRCHPVVAFPTGWDIWHSSNHWSNEETMKRYLDTVMLPFISAQKKKFSFSSSQRALVIFDGFKGQNTTEFFKKLEDHGISSVTIPPNCTDKLQPLDISVNKSMKNELRNHFQMYYANQVSKQLSNNVAVDEIKVDFTLSAIKSTSASWIMSSWNKIEMHPEIVINGFAKAGILDIINK